MSDDEEPTERPWIDGWTVLALAASASAALLGIFFKTTSDVGYDVYWYVFGAVVAFYIARDLGLVKLDPLDLLRGRPGGPPAEE